MGKRLSKFSPIILLEYFLSVHFYHFLKLYPYGTKWIIHISLEFLLFKIMVNYWAGFYFDHSRIIELQGGKEPDKSSRTTTHVMPISLLIGILAKYLGAVCMNTSTNMLTTHFPFRAALSVRKFSQFKPQYAVQQFPHWSWIKPWGHRHRSHHFFVELPLWKLKRIHYVTVSHLSPFLTSECTTIWRDISNFGI